jgi:hypothetical protein
MTLHDFALQVTTDALYRDTITARARAGTLPPDIELFLLEVSVDLRPVARRDAPVQSRTFAVIRPAVPADPKEVV